MRIAARETVGWPAALLAVVVLASGCGDDLGSADPKALAATPEPSASAEALAWPLSGAASSTPAGSQAPVASPTRRPASPAPRAPMTVSLSEPLPPTQGITAIYQDRCGDPSRALVYVNVADPTNLSSVWYEYHVATPVPFRGENRGPTVANDFRLWRGMIGPFEANPRNADGGPITITAHGRYLDGTERTVTATFTLRPCRR